MSIGGKKTLMIESRDDKLDLSTGGEGHLNGNEDESLEEAT